MVSEILYLRQNYHFGAYRIAAYLQRFHQVEIARSSVHRILVLQSDNGDEFQSRFHWHAESLDIQHVYIRPASPHLNGKVEQSHRIDEQGFYQMLDQDSIHLFNKKLREWEDYDNNHRPHGALQGRTPYERLVEKSLADVSQGS